MQIITVHRDTPPRRVVTRGPAHNQRVWTRHPQLRDVDLFRGRIVHREDGSWEAVNYEHEPLNVRYDTYREALAALLDATSEMDEPEDFEDLLRWVRDENDDYLNPQEDHHAA